MTISSVVSHRLRQFGLDAQILRVEGEGGVSLSEPARLREPEELLQ